MSKKNYVPYDILLQILSGKTEFQFLEETINEKDLIKILFENNCKVKGIMCFTSEKDTENKTAIQYFFPEQKNKDLYKNKRFKITSLPFFFLFKYRIISVSIPATIHTLHAVSNDRNFILKKLYEIQKKDHNAFLHCRDQDVLKDHQNHFVFK